MTEKIKESVTKARHTHTHTLCVTNCKNKMLFATTKLFFNSSSSSSSSLQNIVPIFSSPTSLLLWSNATRNNVKVYRSLSKFLISSNNDKKTHYLHCCLHALREQRDHQHHQDKDNNNQKLSKVTWANCLAICQAALDATFHPLALNDSDSSVEKQKPYPEDIAALMFPIFSSSSSSLWQHAILFHERFFEKLLKIHRDRNNNNSNNRNSPCSLGPSASASALINCLFDCEKNEFALNAIDKYCDSVPSGHIGNLMHRICKLAAKNRITKTEIMRDLWSRNLLLASVYLTRCHNNNNISNFHRTQQQEHQPTEERVENISRVLEKTCLMMGVVWKLSSTQSGDDVKGLQQARTENEGENAEFSSKENNTSSSPRKFETELRQFARNESGNTESIYKKFYSTSRFKFHPKFHVMDHRLQRCIFSFLVLGDEVTLRGEIKRDKRDLMKALREAAPGDNNHHNNHESWVAALKLAAETSALGSSSLVVSHISCTAKKDTCNTANFNKQHNDMFYLEKIFAQREILGICSASSLYQRDLPSSDTKMIIGKSLSFLRPSDQEAEDLTTWIQLLLLSKQKGNGGDENVDADSGKTTSSPKRHCFETSEEETIERMCLTRIRIKILEMKILLFFSSQLDVQTKMDELMKSVARNKRADDFTSPSSSSSSFPQMNQHQHQQLDSENRLFDGDKSFLRTTLACYSCLAKDTLQIRQADHNHTNNEQDQANDDSFWIRALRLCSATKARGASVQEARAVCFPLLKREIVSENSLDLGFVWSWMGMLNQ